MSTEYQPKFNRMSLNVLMLASAALIVIFGQSVSQMDQKPLPPAPKLDISIWHADSGAKIWYSPYFSETLEIQLWYQAGYALDNKYSGRASLLAKLLKFESKRMQLPMQVALDADFLKVTLHLSTDPMQMKQQIEKSVALLYRPILPSKGLKALQAISKVPTLSDELWQQAYAEHPYGQLSATHSQVTRAQLQKYQRSHIHPKRLNASVVGDISERGAQIIMESLLPPSKYKAAKQNVLPIKPTSNIENRQQLIAIWPGESNVILQGNELTEASIKLQKQQITTHINKQMVVQLLKAVHGDSVKWHPGKANSTLLIQQSNQIKHAVQDQIDSDMIAHQTHQLAKKWLAQVNNASGLSQYLVQLNAYQLPVNQLNKNLIALDGWDDDDWETASETLLPWLYKD
jgi:hypothetical protein